MPWSVWVMCQQKKTDGISLQDEMAGLDCLIAKNRPELRSQGLVELSTISNESTLSFSSAVTQIASEAGRTTLPLMTYLRYLSKNFLIEWLLSTLGEC